MNKCNESITKRNMMFFFIVLCSCGALKNFLVEFNKQRFFINKHITIDMLTELFADWRRPSDILTRCFAWSQTSQGTNYWISLESELVKKEKMYDFPNAECVRTSSLSAIYFIAKKRLKWRFKPRF